MRKKLPILLVIVCCLLCVLCACADNTSLNSGRKINSVNHRGYTDAPENTLSAFRMSKKMGFDMVECDVTFTKDGVPVLLHDETVNRTSDGRGKIRDLTFEQVRQMDFGSWKDDKFKGEKIPTFVEFLELCAELSLHPYVEIKGNVSDEELQLLSEIAKDADLPLTWICFNIEILQKLAQIFPEGRFGYLVYFITDIVTQRIEEISTDKNIVFADCCYATLSTSQIESCQNLNIPLEVWTLNNESKIANIDPYISGVTSDKYNAEQIFSEL